MKRAAASVSVSMYTSLFDQKLYNLKEALESRYWAEPQSIYSFRFITDRSPLTNLRAPLYFQLLRYKPSSFNYRADVVSLDGVINNDGTIEYAGIKGVLLNDNIKWSDGNVWTKIDNVPHP